MSKNLAVFFRETLERELPCLLAISEEQASLAPATAGNWTRKQELGHLLDSAANNHIRFVRAALEGKYEGPGYAQDDWVNLHAWQQLPWAQIVDFWMHQNLLLIHLVSRIPAERMDTLCVVGGSSPVTLAFLIEDYVLHMQHHIDHLLSRAEITQYPGAKLGV